MLFREHYRISIGYLWAFCGFGVSNICVSIYNSNTESRHLGYFVPNAAPIYEQNAGRIFESVTVCYQFTIMPS